MSELTEPTIDAPLDGEKQKAPGGLKAVAVFTYIGKVLLLIASIGFLVGLFFAEDYMVKKVKDADVSSSNWLMGTRILCIVYILSSIGAIIGVNKMKKGKKKGFYLYALSNALLIGFLVINANIVELIFAAILALFICLYVPFLRKLS